MSSSEFWASLSHAARREWSFEEEIVRRLLKQFGLQKTKHALLTDMEQRTGVKHLSLAMFYQRFPSFPVCLSASTASKLDKDCSTRRLFFFFNQTKLVSLWEQALAEAPPQQLGKPFGLVLKWPRSPDALVFRDGAAGDHRGSRLEIVSQQRTYYLEPLKSLLQSLYWEPGADV